MEKRLLNACPILFDLTNLLGIGGESVVFKIKIDNVKKAIKVAPCETLSPAEMTIVRNAMKKLKINRELDFELAVDEENLKLLEKNAEYSSTKWKHENLISYND